MTIRIFTLLFLPFALLFLSACQLTYIVESGYNQALLIKNQQPISELMLKKEIPEKTKSKFLLTAEIKEFMESELGLKKTTNYSSYVELDRKYVSYIVQVAEPYELKYYYWHFPIVGKLPYKGYFNEQSAKTEANLFQKKGYDTFVRGVRAYSTLGWFQDPILSSMIDYQDDDFVNLIIHETTHATLFIKSSADFNEQLATFVGNKGTELFYLKKEGPNSPTLKNIKNKNSDENLFSQFITNESKDLEAWYETHKNDIAAKNKKFSEIKERFKKIKFQSNQYDFFANMELNNAVILGFKTYVNDLSKFERVFNNSKDMRDFISKIKSLEKSESPEQDLLKL